MKLFRNLGAVAVLSLAGCMAPGPVMIPTEGALTRQVERIVLRHDAYVQADARLVEQERSAYLAQSGDALALVQGMPQGVPAQLLYSKLTPVLARHDGYVRVDLSLDPLDGESYLASSEGLKSLMKAAMRGWSPEEMAPVKPLRLRSSIQPNEPANPPDNHP